MPFLLSFLSLLRLAARRFDARNASVLSIGGNLRKTLSFALPPAEVQASETTVSFRGYAGFMEGRGGGHREVSDVLSLGHKSRKKFRKCRRYWQSLLSFAGANRVHPPPISSRIFPRKFGAAFDIEISTATAGLLFQMLLSRS